MLIQVRRVVLIAGIMPVAFASSAAPQLRDDAALPAATAPKVAAKPNGLERDDAVRRAEAAKAYGRLPLYFEPNEGQVAGSTQFVSRGAGYGLLLTPSASALVLQSRDAVSERARASGRQLGTGAKASSSTLRLALVGADAEATSSGEEPLPGRSHYLVGNDPARWHTDIPQYARVRFHQVYPGIDLTYYGNQGQLEYDFVVSPGADPRRIRFKVEGAQSARLNGDDLVLTTPSGDVTEKAPVIYQEADGLRRTVTGHYVLAHSGEVGFELAAYDRTLPLVIDPVLRYSTYLGGNGSLHYYSNQMVGDSGAALAVGPDGSVVVTGSALSLDFPTRNAFQGAPQGGRDAQNWDAFVAKLSPDGSTLLYSTYLGGNDNDLGAGIAVDSSGHAIVAGETSSMNFPTSHAFQGPPGDADRFVTSGFVTKLSPDGSSLVYSTYLRGSQGITEAWALALDDLGDAYLTGWTSEPDFPTSNWAFQPHLKAQQYDSNAFVAKLDVNGAFAFGTFLGGSGSNSGGDVATGIALDAVANMYVTGWTDSPDFPTQNAAQNVIWGDLDAFVTKISNTGQSLIYSTYLGGSNWDLARAIAADSDGNAYVAGATASVDFFFKYPFQAWLKGPSDAFVTKLDPQGALVYSSYLGGASDDAAFGITADAFGNAFVTGNTTSADFPVAKSLPPPIGGSDANQAFMTKIHQVGPGFANIAQSVLLGGNGVDSGAAVALDRSGNVYVTGTSNSPNFHRRNALQPVKGDYSNAFITKLGTSAASDVTGEGFGDIIWRHANGGGDYVWFMNGAVAQNMLPFQSPSLDWIIAGIGDANGDGLADLIWRDNVTGENAVWFMSGNAPTGVYLPSVVDQHWKIAAVADIDGDGKADLVWRNVVTGEDSVWLLDGAVIAKGINLSTIDPSWTIAGAGDFDGDGRADLLWRNPNTGENKIWLLSADGNRNVRVKSSQSLGMLAGAWAVVGTGDLNADGRADVLWHNSMSGTNVAWLMMDGLAHVGGALPATSDPSHWNIASITDLDGDNEADLIWRNSATGQNMAWFMDGMVVRRSATLTPVPDLGWQIVGAR